MIKAILSDFSRVILLPKKAPWGSFIINSELLNIYTQLKLKYRLKLFIFTNSSSLIFKSPLISSNLKIFDQIFQTDPTTQSSKRNPIRYLKIAEQIKIKPDEILFIDDQEANLQAAQKAGLNTILFQGNEKLHLDLKRFFNRIEN